MSLVVGSTLFPILFLRRYSAVNGDETLAQFWSPSTEAAQMLTGIGAAFHRLFSSSHGDVRGGKRKRELCTEDELDDPMQSRRKYARHDARNNFQEQVSTWMQRAAREPLRNYFVNSIVRCFYHPSPPATSLPESSSSQYQPTRFHRIVMPKRPKVRQSIALFNTAAQRDGRNDSFHNGFRAGSSTWVKPPSPEREGIQQQASTSRCEKPTLTPYNCIRLREKEEYRLLLQQFTKHDFSQPRKKPSVKDAATMATESLLAPKARHGLLQPTNTTAMVAAPKKLHRSVRTGALEQHKPAKVTEWKPVVTKSSFLEKVATNPHLSPGWLSDFKERLKLSEQDDLTLIKRQQKVCEELRAELEKERRVQEEVGVPKVPEEAAPEVEILPELTPEMEAAIDGALRPTPPDEVLATGFRLLITRRDMETLAGLNWLNDEVINFYMNLLVERGRTDNYPSVYAFNTFFYPKLITGGHAALKRWTRKVDLFSHDLVLVPVHLGAHWCLAVIDFRSKKVQYYDSMGGSNPECLEALRNYLQDESLDKRGEELDMSEWTLEAVKGVPQQMNGSDCGMFALKYAEYITRDAKITFNQMNMPYFRRRMVYEILTKKLL